MVTSMRQRFWIWLYKFVARRIERKPMKRPTLAELERILNDPTYPKQVLLCMPDGSMTAVDK
jgi:hypothetical protein